MRFALSFVTVLLLTGCAHHRAPVAVTYATEATLTRTQEDGPYLFLARVSRLAEQHGKITEQFIARPVFEVKPGVPDKEPSAEARRKTGSFPYARWSDKPPTVKQIEEYVEVEVAWEGEHSEIAVFILTVKIDEKIVSMTRMRIRAREQSL
jgi:hypothetical protein